MTTIKVYKDGSESPDLLFAVWVHPDNQPGISQQQSEDAKAKSICENLYDHGYKHLWVEREERQYVRPTITKFSK